MEQLERDTQTRPEKMLLSLREAGYALGLSVWTVGRLVKQGKLTSVRLNRRVLVEVDECRRFIARNRRPPKIVADTKQNSDGTPYAFPGDTEGGE